MGTHGKMIHEHQHKFTLTTLKKIDKKRKPKDGDSRQSNTINYYAKGNDVRVCKNFFDSLIDLIAHH